MILPLSTCFHKLAVPAGAKEPTEKDPDGAGWQWDWEGFGLKNPLRYLIGRVTTEQLVIDLAQAEIEDQLASTLDDMVVRAELTMVTNEFKVFVDRRDAYQDAFMTDIWDGVPASYRTKHQGRFYIHAPFVNWLAGATPEQFVDNMPPSALEQGWMSRILPVWWSQSPLEQQWEYESPDPKTVEFLQQDLASIAKMRGQFHWENEELHQEANDWLRSGGKPKPTDPKMAGYLERRAAHLMKIIMAVAAANHDEVVIKREDFLQAQSYLFEIEADMPKALQLFGSSEVGRTSLELADMVKSVFQLKKRGMTMAEFKAAVLSRARSAGDVSSLVQAMDAAGLIRITDAQQVLPAGPIEDHVTRTEKTKAPSQRVDISPEAEMQAKIP